jgi:tetratricopeptide (TPR) repeat protein
VKLSICVIKQYLALGLLEEAKPELAEWSKLRTEVRKRSAKHLFTQLSTISEQYVKQGRYDDADWLLDWLDRQTTEVLPRDWSTIEWLNRVASHRCAMGRLDQAQSAQEEALRRLKTDAISDVLLHEVALNNLGDIFRERQEFDAEETIRRERLRLLQAVESKDKAILRLFADAHKELAIVLQQKGEIRAALDHIQEATRVLAAAEIRNQWDNAVVDVWFGCFLVEMKEYDRGREVLLKHRSYILDVVRRNPSAKAHLDNAVRLEMSLSIVCSHYNDHAMAREYYENALELIANPKVAKVFEALREYQPVPYRDQRERAAAMLAVADEREQPTTLTEPEHNNSLSDGDQP